METETQGWLDASYFFHPHAADAAPTWVLLNYKAGYTNCDNATTAYAMTSAGRTVKVTFCLASPPSVSHLRVHYTDSQRAGFDSAKAEVISSAKDLILLRCSTRREPNDVEYFLYHAAAGKPSLRAIPSPPMPTIEEPRTRVTSSRIAISPCINDGAEFLLAYLAVIQNPPAYELRVFSSKTWAWDARARTLLPPAGVRYDEVPRRFDKVIALGGSVLGWVDLGLGGGIIACDVVDPDPARTRFIPLPKSDFHKNRDRSPLPVHRDVACYSDGFIVLVDLDTRFRYVALDEKDEKKTVIKAIRDLDHANAILDSELICQDQQLLHVRHVPDGWKIRTCYRHVSWDYWRTGHLVDVDDIAVLDLRHRTVLSELWDGGAGGRLTLRKLEAKLPTLSMQQGGHVVYLTVVSKKGHNGRQIQSERENQILTISIDLAKKTVEMLQPYDDGDFFQRFILSQHVVSTPPAQQNMLWNIDGCFYDGYADARHAAGYGYDTYLQHIYTHTVT